MFRLTWVAYDNSGNPLIQYFTITQSVALLELRRRFCTGAFGGKNDGAS